MSVQKRQYDWESLTCLIAGKELIGIKDVEYNEELEKEAIYGKGSEPIGWGQGNFKREGKLTILKTEYAKLKLLAIVFGNNVLKLPPFPMTLKYHNEDQPLRVTNLMECTFTKHGGKLAQGDKASEVELPFLILGTITDIP